jgi:anti-sigma regulatory factor (Ser/Thr protein kinase)
VEEVARARRWLTEHALAAGFPEDETGRVGLALSEACANVIEHAYGGQPGHDVDLELDVNAERLVVSIKDTGRPFDPASYRPPDLSRACESGYGVHLMRSIMDEVRYAPSAGGGTQLTMVRLRQKKL